MAADQTHDQGMGESRESRESIARKLCSAWPCLPRSLRENMGLTALQSVQAHAMMRECEHLGDYAMLQKVQDMLSCM